MTLCFTPRLFKKMERPWKNFSHFENSFLFCSWPLDERSFVLNHTCRLSHGIKHRGSIQCDNIDCIKTKILYILHCSVSMSLYFHNFEMLFDDISRYYIFSMTFKTLHTLISKLLRKFVYKLQIWYHVKHVRSVKCWFIWNKFTFYGTRIWCQIYKHVTFNGISINKRNVSPYLKLCIFKQNINCDFVTKMC